jgi:hypothetical protein
MIGAITSRPLLPCRISNWCPDAIGFDVKFHRETKDEELYKHAIVIDKGLICVSGKKIKLARVDDVYNAVITSVVGTSNDHETFSYVDYDELLMHIESVKNPSDIHDILNFKLRNVHAVVVDCYDKRSDSVSCICSSLPRYCFIPCVASGKSKDGVEYSESVSLLQRIVKMPMKKVDI